MPLSEVHRTATRKELESSQSRMTNYSSDLSSFMPDDEFVELLWENGQLVVQGQSRPKKSSFTSNASSQTCKAHDKDGNANMGRFSSMDQVVDEISPTVPSVVGLNSQEDDYSNRPWMNSPFEDPLVQSDYCSEFLSEFSGVDLNSVGTNAKGNSNVVATTTTERITSFGFARASQSIQVGNASRGITAGSDPSSRIRKSQLFHLPQQCQSAIPNSKPKEAAEFGNHGSTSSYQGAAGGGGGLHLNTGSQKQEDTANTKLPQARSGSRGGAGLMNFSHFSRAASLFKANLQGSDRLRSNEKASTAGSSNPPESSLLNTNGGDKSISGAIQGKPASTLPHDVAPKRSSTKSTQDVASVQQAEAHKNQGKVAIASSKPSDQSKGQSTGLSGRPETEKAPEAAVASSVCSGNSVGAASNDPKYGSVKRKCREGEESEYQSDDVEDDSVGLKKCDSARCKSGKRSRAAEVHNLSERRRRDRINERMRALQELIPNCNKVDKASMLDEAIEYLKTLQLQVQIMSMGAGLCMPPMMMPPAMQHLRAAPMYSPMSVGMGYGMGMGMGMGYGMGMLDMNGAPSLHGMPGGPASLQMFGMPGQGLPIPTPQLPQYTPYSTLPLRPNTMGERSVVAGTTCPVSATPSVVETAPSSCSNDPPHLNMNSEAPHQTKSDDSPIPTSSIQALKEQSVVMSDHALHVSGNSTTNSIRENESGAP